MSAVLLDLGKMEYGEAWALQKDLAAKRAADEIPDTLILVEHDHVVTLGRKTSPQNFRPQNVPVFLVERGGDATYHGPGQLVGYPIEKLVDHDVRRHVRNIEVALMAAVGRFDVKGELKEGHPGVWVGGRKLASIGVAVTDWVTYHGFALNVNTDMSYFELIRPCGLDPSAMVSMKELLGRTLDMEAVKKAVAEEYASTTGRRLIQQELPLSLPEKH